ncbi:alpha/beta fold hydrolase [Micromonospora profundi]|uniref:thioesterase II family protein n=1 Tax=Micromonospora profundi TaxID=1420889 RepID=UPI0033B35A8A
MPFDSASPWFLQTWAADAPPRLRIFCFPHGGAGPSVFRGWGAFVASDVEVVPVQLPGRERRTTEPLARSIAELRDRIVGPLIECAENIPYAFVGHSMGALIAYELCHELRDAPNPPAALAVTGSAAPHLPRRVPEVRHLPDDELLDHLSYLNGTPAELLTDLSWLNLLLPVLRADFTACEDYVPADRPPLDLPMLAMGGTDDPLVTPDEVRHWQDLNASSTAVRFFDGDHFFVFQHAEEVLAIVERAARGVDR